MTIKQQGGIFGRNPTFNEVNVEGGLSVDGSSYTNFKENGSDIGSVFVTGDKIGIGTLNNGIAFDQSSNIILPFNPQTLLKRDGELDLGYAAGKFKDLYLSGNVIVDNGKGIDFSATSGTGTSELFDDYEEGTFTPTLEASGGGAPSSYSTRVGSYTKIGDTVYILINLAVHAGTLSGDIKVTGLPFSPSESSSIYTAAYRRWNTTFVSYGLIDSGTSAVRIIKSTNNAISETPVTNSDMLSTANRNSLIISGCYRTT
jgi:hypothetical protein